MMNNLLSQAKFGTVTLPKTLSDKYGTTPEALGQLLNIILNTLVVFGGIWALINLVLAGYAFIGAGDDPKKVAGAWAKIWQTMLGLVFIAGSYTLAAIFGYLIFGKFDAILNPTIQIPK